MRPEGGEEDIEWTKETSEGQSLSKENILIYSERCDSLSFVLIYERRHCGESEGRAIENET